MNTNNQIKNILSDFFTENSALFPSGLAVNYGQLMLKVNDTLNTPNNTQYNNIFDIDAHILEALQDLKENDQWLNIVKEERPQDIDDYLSMVFNRVNFEFCDLVTASYNLPFSVALEMMREIDEYTTGETLENIQDEKHLFNYYACCVAGTLYHDQDDEDRHILYIPPCVIHSNYYEEEEEEDEEEE